MALFQASGGGVRPAQTRTGCTACTLSNTWSKLAHPKIVPDTRGVGGDNLVDIYFLGGAPGSQDDAQGIPFVSDGGQMLRNAMRNWPTDINYIFSNVCRCHPPESRSPSAKEMDACWGAYGQPDFLSYKPFVVVPFGGEALSRFFPGGIAEWNGVRVPHAQDGHSFWVCPLYHPSYLMNQKKRDYGESDAHKIWRRSLDALWRGVTEWENPKVVSHAEAVEGIQVFLPNQLQELRQLILAQPKGLRAVDLETNGLMPWGNEARILSASVSFGSLTVAWLIDHPENPYVEESLELLYDTLSGAAGLIAHNAVFEQRWLAAAFGLRAFGWRWHDTMARPYAQFGVIQGTREEEGFGRLAGLGKQTRMHYGFDVKAVTNVDPMKWRQTPVADLLLYNGTDSKWTYRLWHEPLQDWAKIEVFRQNNATRAAAAISWQGILIDRAELARQTEKLENSVATDIKVITQDAEVVNWEIKHRLKFNPASPDQVAKFFNLENADEDALREVDSPLAARILRLRKLDKLLSTYARGLLKSVYMDGYLHPDFSTMRVATGRWACQNPNAMNMPIRENKEFRKIIVPPKGKALVSIDYAQLEARGIAIATGDNTMLSYVWEEQDIHKEWAIELLDSYPQIADRLCPRVTDDKIVVARVRGEMKNGFVFPLFYGAGIPKCAGELQAPHNVVEAMYNKFWAKYKGARKWQDETHAFYADNLFVETLTRRRRFGPLSWTEQLNSPIQGTGSDIVVDAAIQLVDLAVGTNDAHFIPMVNVHDDLSFYLPTVGLDRYIQMIARIMVTPRYPWVTVPLKVEVKIGHANWSEQHEFRSYSTGDFHPLPKSGISAQVRALQAIARNADSTTNGPNASRRVRLASPNQEVILSTSGGGRTDKPAERVRLKTPSAPAAAPEQP